MRRIKFDFELQRCQQNKRRHWGQTWQHNSICIDIYWWHCNGICARMEVDARYHVDFPSYFHFGRSFYQSKWSHRIDLAKFIG